MFTSRVKHHTSAILFVLPRPSLLRPNQRTNRTTGTNGSFSLQVWAAIVTGRMHVLFSPTLILCFCTPAPDEKKPSQPLYRLQALPKWKFKVFTHHHHQNTSNGNAESLTQMCCAKHKNITTTNE